MTKLIEWAKPVVREQASVALNFVGLDGILPLLA